MSEESQSILRQAKEIGAESKWARPTPIGETSQRNAKKIDEAVTFPPISNRPCSSIFSTDNYYANPPVHAPSSAHWMWFLLQAPCPAC